MAQSNAQKLTAFAQAVGEDVKAINRQIGATSNLQTTAKTDLVSAINELKTDVQAAANSGGASINDTRPSTNTVYSSQKTDELIATSKQQAITAAVTQAKNEILGGEVAAELDTLREIATELTQNKSAAASITSQLAGHNTRISAIESVLETDLVATYRTAKGA